MDPQLFPIPAPTFHGSSRQVDIGNLFSWFRQGWATFVANPGNWLAMMLIVILVFAGLSIVPLIGVIAIHLVTPLFAAGMLAACRKVAEEQPFTIGDLFASFQQRATPLLSLGVLYMVGMLATNLLWLLFAGGSVAGGLLFGNPLGWMFAASGILLGGLLWLLLLIPLVMALWFAPALVFFNDMQPLAALRASFQAWLKNLATFLVFILMLFILSFFAALPLGLGLLVLGPVLAGTVYASYRDIFLTA